VAALIYPAEYDAEVAARLLEADYKGGRTVDAGPSRVADYYAAAQVIERAQVFGALDRAERSPEEIFAAVGRNVVRLAV
jgi:hypothetical protein